MIRLFFQIRVRIGSIFSWSLDLDSEFGTFNRQKTKISYFNELQAHAGEPEASSGAWICVMSA
jgi:hypothetical protein